MKAQIGVRITPMSGFLNFDAAARQDEQDRILVDPGKLDPFIDNNELDEFLLNNILDFLPLQQRAQVLQHLLSKVAHGGLLVITGNDPHEMSRLCHIGNIDTGQLNNLWYGMGFKSAVRPEDMINAVVQTGQYEYEGCKYNNYQYCVMFRRR